MPFRAARALLALLLLAGCAAGRSPADDAAQPLPAGITPLTVEQEEQIGG